MAQINLQVNSLGFYDNSASNSPQLRAFDITYKLFGIQTNNPEQKPFVLAPGESKTIFDGSRVHSVDNTTAFTISRPDPTVAVYRFTSSAGTSPAFRTDRAPGITTSTVFAITTNGPLAVLTATTGPFITTNIQIGDIVKLDSGCGCSAGNQGRFSILAKTSNSITIQNLNASAESFTVLSVAKVLIYSNGGNAQNQAQIGDKVVLSAGFSQSTLGTYDVVEVTPLWFEVRAGQLGGIPIETGILPGATGIVFYSAAKKFVLIAAQDKVSARFNSDTSDNSIIEPIEAANPEKAGLLIKNGNCYKLVITNLSVNSTQILVASGD